MTEIDLSSNVVSVPTNLRRSITEFADSHPDVEISCIALMFQPYGGNIFVSFDTPQNSDALVSKYRGKDEWCVEKDERGWFCVDPPSFAFFQSDEFELTDYPYMYDAFTDGYVNFRFPSGEVCKSDSANENLAKILGCFLSSLLANFNDFGALKKSPVFRMGVFTNDGYRKYWIPGERSSDKIEYEIPKLRLPKRK